MGRGRTGYSLDAGAADGLFEIDAGGEKVAGKNFARLDPGRRSDDRGRKYFESRKQERRRSKNSNSCFHRFLIHLFIMSSEAASPNYKIGNERLIQVTDKAANKLASLLDQKG